MVTSGYTILGGGALARLEERSAAIGRRLEPFMWILTLVGFAITVYPIVKKRLA